MGIGRRRTMLGVALLALTLPTGSARAVVHDHAKSSAWIMGLKCRDLIDQKAASINREIYPVYSIWLRGYIAGVSSLAPVSITSHVKFSDVSSSLLTYCTVHQDENGVEAAVHIGSLFYNVLNPRNVGADLHQPGHPQLPD